MPRKRKSRPKSRAAFYSVEARFPVQIEGMKSGLQHVEDRVILVLASSEKEAERIARREFISYEKPYLNGSGKRVRWHFDHILGVTELPYSKVDPRGTEVHSRVWRRRMKKDFEWNPR